MSTIAEKRRYTVAEYLALEQDSPTKHEYYRGEIFAMAGATPRHNRIAGNIFGKLYQRLEGKPCEPFGSDQRIRIKAVNHSTYPDVSVICGTMEVADDDRHAATNPTVLVEVLSLATEAYDRGRKFEFYQQLPSLREYVLVSQHEAKITHYSLNEDGSWHYRLIVGLEQTLDLPAIACQLPLAEIYRNVKFGPEELEGAPPA